MAGHSKWANIKHKKAAQDKKRGKIFTKLIKEITVAAKVGGVNPEGNPRLRAAIMSAKQQSVPKDNIDRALKKAAGKDADNFEELTYEAYGPGGVAIFIEAATDNLTRTVSNLRSYLNKYNGSLGKDGCLQFVFERKSVFTMPKGTIDVDDLTLNLIDVGAEDVEVEGDQLIVTGPMESFGDIQKKFEELHLEAEEAGLQRLPTNFKALDQETFDRVMKLIDVLEDDDDIQKVYHNIEFDEKLLGENV